MRIHVPEKNSRNLPKPMKIWRRFSNSRKSRDNWRESTEFHSPLIVIACRDRFVFSLELEELLNQIKFNFLVLTSLSFSSSQWNEVDSRNGYWSEMLMQNFQTRKRGRKLPLKFLRCEHFLRMKFLSHETRELINRNKLLADRQNYFYYLVFNASAMSSAGCWNNFGIFIGWKWLAKSTI